MRRERERERESLPFIYGPAKKKTYVTHFIKKCRCKIWMKWNVLRKVQEKDKKIIRRWARSEWVDEKIERERKEKEVSGLGKVVWRKYKKQ